MTLHKPTMLVRDHPHFPALLAEFRRALAVWRDPKFAPERERLPSVGEEEFARRWAVAYLRAGYDDTGDEPSLALNEEHYAQAWQDTRSGE